MMHALRIVGGLIVAAGLIYLQYRYRKSISDGRDPKADVQTLFSGKK